MNMSSLIDELRFNYEWFEIYWHDTSHDNLDYLEVWNDYLDKQYKLLTKIGSITDSYDANSFSYGCKELIDIPLLVEKFNEAMRNYEDEEYLNSLAWRVAPTITKNENGFCIFYRFKEGGLSE